MPISTSERHPSPARLTRWRGVLWAAGLFYGCGGSSFPPNASARPAADVPSRFEPPDSLPRLTPADTLVGAGCLSPMSDPRDGTRLTMVRGMAGVADYAVPEGRYGVAAGHLLRLDCNTGRVLGVVRR